MSTAILLSIKPKFAQAILEGTKTYEFRRTIFKNDIKKIVIYASSPTQQVIGEISVEQIITKSIKELWRLTKRGAGIDYDYYMDYFTGKDRGCAIKLFNPHRYDNPKYLREHFNVQHAPQSFIYIRADSIYSMTESAIEPPSPLPQYDWIRRLIGYNESMLIRPANVADLPFMVSIGRRNARSIGFIPAPRLEKEIMRKRVLVLEDNKDELGYVYFGAKRDSARRIFQIVVRDDARRLHYASELLRGVDASNILGRCAVDIEGLKFWRAKGGVEIRRLPPKKTGGRQIVCFELARGKRLF